MQTSNQPPYSWLIDFVKAIQWPVIVLGAVYMGRLLAKFEARALTAEKSLHDLIARHMPHIHTRLNDLKTRMEILQASVWAAIKGKP